MDLEIIGHRLQKARKSKKLKQAQVAEMAFIHEKYLSNIERGKDSCSMTVLLGLANILDLSIDYLLGDNLNYNRRLLESGSGQLYEQLLFKLKALDQKDQKYALQFLEMLEEYKKD